MIKKITKKRIVHKKKISKKKIHRFNPTIFGVFLVVFIISGLLSFNIFKDRLSDVLGITALNYLQLESTSSARPNGVGGTVCAGKNVQMKRLLLTSWCGKKAKVTCPEQGRITVNLAELSPQQKTLINPNGKRCLTQSQWDEAAPKLCLCGLSAYPTARMVLKTTEDELSRGVAAVEFRTTSIEGISKLVPFQFRSEVQGLSPNQKYVALVCTKRATSINLFVPDNCLVLDETYTTNRKGNLSIQSDLFGGLEVLTSDPLVGVLICPRSASDYSTDTCLFGQDPLKISATRIKSPSSLPIPTPSSGTGGPPESSPSGSTRGSSIIPIFRSDSE